MDLFSLSETVNQKLEYIWNLAHYRYQPPKIEEKINTELEGLSSVERETLETILQVFGINVYVRTRKGGELIAVRHG